MSNQKKKQEEKNILIVYAHPEPTSFTGILKNQAVEYFQQQGHSVAVSDLYEMNWNAVANRTDFTKEVKGFFKLQLEQRQNTLIEEIKIEQAKVEKANLVIFIFPLWRLRLPAILKGWFDPTPWSYQWPKLYNNGIFKDKKALLCVTTPEEKVTFSERGLFGNISKITYPLTHGCLYFCGFNILPPIYHYSINNEESQEKSLKAWGEKLEKVIDENPIEFNKLTDYGEGGLTEGKKTDFERIGDYL
ncbi:nad p h oxidoreductase-related [Anaeramoeba flamelloides]|uniref:Nad p h oxidoreductase-related n=1 Tax=Anaeramoeba flamelloides TaxID=1746091 RepID=A0ABQ8XQC5_9EUKA|nr:nad p h oxidoreductase-related [Anaeramoeba flamelloides]